MSAGGHGGGQGRDEEEGDLDVNRESLVGLGLGGGLSRPQWGGANVVDEDVDVAVAGLFSPRGQFTG